MLSLIYGSKPWDNVWQTGRNRVRAYARYKQMYDGFAFRGATVGNQYTGNAQYKKLKYNPVPPIINIGAEFLASNEISFQVTGSKELTTLATEIWERSGGASEFLENAVTASIYGDACLMIGYNDDNDLVLKWMDTAVCFPTFSPRDTSKVTDFIIAFRRMDPIAPESVFYEEWSNGIVTSTENSNDGMPKQTATYDESLHGGPPVVWIPNLKLKGEHFGRSDVYPLTDLTEEYDHLMDKQTRIIDYYASPNIYMKGVRKPDMLEKGEKTIIFLPADGDAGFIEWKGTPQSVSEQLERVRDQISESSATPKIAFSNFDFQNSDISGIALKVLFGPLLKKTDRKRTQTWGPGICKALQMAFLELGHKVKLEDIVILWPDPLPANTKEGWEISVMQSLSNVSNRQIQRERGYTADQITQMEQEWIDQKRMENELQIELASGMAEAAPDPVSGKPSSTPGGSKTMSAKQKADHTTETTPGKIVRATPVTGSKGAV